MQKHQLDENNMQILLQNLKPNDGNDFKQIRQHSSSEDEDASDFVSRRKSMNEFNEVGYNFQKHQENKPAKDVTYEIQNMFLEYKESEDKVHAKEEFIEICDRNSIEKYKFIGYFLNNSLSEKPTDFE